MIIMHIICRHKSTRQNTQSSLFDANLPPAWMAFFTNCNWMQISDKSGHFICAFSFFLLPAKLTGLFPVCECLCLCPCYPGTWVPVCPARRDPFRWWNRLGVSYLCLNSITSPPTLALNLTSPECVVYIYTCISKHCLSFGRNIHLPGRDRQGGSDIFIA